MNPRSDASTMRIGCARCLIYTISYKVSTRARIRDFTPSHVERAPHAPGLYAGLHAPCPRAGVPLVDGQPERETSAKRARTPVVVQRVSGPYWFGQPVRSVAALAGERMASPAGRSS